MPVTVPDEAPIEAIVGGVPDHVLDDMDTASLSIILWPGHTVFGPVIGAGFGTIVTTMPFVFVHPDPSVAVTEYVVVTEGVAITFWQVVQLSPVLGVQDHVIGIVALVP